MPDNVNVKVVVRCRPMSSKEIQMGSKAIIEVSEGKSIIIRNPNASKEYDEPTKNFIFDHAYYTQVSQQTVYDDIGKSIVDQAVQGYNGTIFAYGQTGSGKTHTMMGTEDDVGVIPMMNNDIFSRTENMSKEKDMKFLISVSYLEIYNEIVKDLLNPSDKVLKIREHPNMGIYVEHLAELIVKSAAEVTKLIEQGNKVRQVAETQMNARSSRSHSCFTLKISSKREEVHDETTKTIAVNAKINLVDLAGSERASKTGATGDRLKEGAAINKSLSALGNVINMLADSTRKKHVPYRDSKLTRLLQESLGGNSLTVMVAAISPADYNYDETLGTLQYANRAKSIKNVTKKNEDVNEKLIRELREEIERLRVMVQGQQSGIQVPGSTTETPGMSDQMEEMIANLERAKQGSWEEQKRLASEFEEERRKNLGNDGNILKFMETVKEEKVETIKRIRMLQQEKLKSAKEYRIQKEAYSLCKNKLQDGMDAYQNKLASENPSDLERENILEAILKGVEENRAQLLKERDLLAAIKQKQKDIDVALDHEKAEMSAKSAVIQEDEKLRKAIQQDERTKMEKEREKYLKDALQVERERMENETEKMRKQLEESQSNTANEKKLKYEIYQHKKEGNAMKIQIKQLKITQMKEKTKIQSEFQDLFEGIVESFYEEKRIIEEKYHEVLLMLKKAKEDITYLTNRNQVLEKQLAHESYWEPK